MGEPEEVLQPFSEHEVWAVLRRYARSGPGAGSQLGKLGAGRGHFMSAAQDMRCTVGCKLARAPLVERVLWLNEASEFVRNVVEGNVKKGWMLWQLVTYEPANVISIAHTLHYDSKKIDEAARSLSHERGYREQMLLLCCEYAACAADPQSGAAFLAWVYDKAHERPG